MIKFCKDIGLFTVNRPRTSCVHATHFCRRMCYHGKFEKLYEHHRAALEQREEEYWQALDVNKFSEDFRRKKKFKGRFRFMSRGEALKDLQDVDKIARILSAWPDTLFMLPTRAWRNRELLVHMSVTLDIHPNLRLLFSTDPESYDQCMSMLAEHNGDPFYKNIHVTFFGDDTREFQDGREFLCPKTWYKKLHPSVMVNCAACKSGCFSKPRGPRLIIHFKTH